MNEQAGHTLHVAIEEGGLDLRIVCHEGVNASCRRTCVRGCEEVCPDPDKHTEDTGECLAAEWINAESVDDYYVGEKRPIRDGMPIEVDWDGEDWNWSIPETADALQEQLTSPVGSVLQ